MKMGKQFMCTGSCFLVMVFLGCRDERQPPKQPPNETVAKSTTSIKMDVAKNLEDKIGKTIEIVEFASTAKSAAYVQAAEIDTTPFPGIVRVETLRGWPAHMEGLRIKIRCKLKEIRTTPPDNNQDYSQRFGSPDETIYTCVVLIEQKLEEIEILAKAR